MVICSLHWEDQIVQSLKGEGGKGPSKLVHIKKFLHNRNFTIENTAIA